MNLKELKILLVLCMIFTIHYNYGQSWTEKQRGSWVVIDAGKSGDIILVNNEKVVDIVVSPKENTCVFKAAEFLALDIEKITGKKPKIVTKSSEGNPSIHLVTYGVSKIPKAISDNSLKGKWEAYNIKTKGNTVWLIGSNARGTAFASYTLSERLGIDPLYLWSGYEPDKHPNLTMQAVNISVDEPTFKYRGMVHDDKDIIPKPIDNKGYKSLLDENIPDILKESHIQTLEKGYPLQTGTVDMIWWERFFETALRLRMNQVSPYVRVVRDYEVQKMASDWGLFYGSHHYDMLLSNPWGYDRFGLAEKRGIKGAYNWETNRDGMIKYWEAGVKENKDLNCIWPVGLRGTDDVGHLFPEGTPAKEQSRIFSEIIEKQIEITKNILPKNSNPIFHLTLYSEVQQYYQAGFMNIPEDVIVVWSDDGDGKMRALPNKLGKNKHGVYYHLAFHGWAEKQTVHTINPNRIEEQFKQIVASGATEYMLLNISELREFVMNTRFIADICWDAKTAFEKPDAANRFVNWWGKEYFGEAATKDVITTYNNYFDIIHSSDQIYQGALALDYALYYQRFRMYGDLFTKSLTNKDWLHIMEKRVSRYDKTMEVANRAMANMNDQQAQFFFENAMYGMLIDYRSSQAALAMNKALYTTWNGRPEDRAYAQEAMGYLTTLQQETKHAERAPFEDWYRDTFQRGRHSLTSVHYSYYRLQEWMEEFGIEY